MRDGKMNNSRSGPNSILGRHTRFLHRCAMTSRRRRRHGDEATSDARIANALRLVSACELTVCAHCTVYYYHQCRNKCICLTAAAAVVVVGGHKQFPEALDVSCVREYEICTRPLERRRRRRHVRINQSKVSRRTFNIQPTVVNSRAERRAIAMITHHSFVQSYSINVYWYNIYVTHIRADAPARPAINQLFTRNCTHQRARATSHA